MQFFLRTNVPTSWWAALLPLAVLGGVLWMPIRASGAKPPPPSGLPDLTLDAARLASSMVIQTLSFTSASCEVVEGCVQSTGTRRVLRFDVSVRNTGTGNLSLGNPQNNPLYQYSPCHGHYHFSNFATYELVGLTNTARKQAFCLEDYEPIPGYPNPPSRQFTCNKQGISVGWQDTYRSILPCQWLDITGVPSGTYTLRVTVDPFNLIPETDNNNNIGQATVTIP